MSDDITIVTFVGFLVGFTALFARLAQLGAVVVLGLLLLGYLTGGYMEFRTFYDAGLGWVVDVAWPHRDLAVAFGLGVVIGEVVRARSR